jgi:hypothetical protein
MCSRQKSLMFLPPSTSAVTVICFTSVYHKPDNTLSFLFTFVIFKEILKIIITVCLYAGHGGTSP